MTRGVPANAEVHTYLRRVFFAVPGTPSLSAARVRQAPVILPAKNSRKSANEHGESIPTTTGKSSSTWESVATSLGERAKKVPGTSVKKSEGIRISKFSLSPSTEKHISAESPNDTIQCNAIPDSAILAGGPENEGIPRLHLRPERTRYSPMCDVWRRPRSR